MNQICKKTLKSRTNFTADRPIETARADRLGRKAFATGLAKQIEAWPGRDSLVIALCGEWGCGKTSLKNMVVERLQARKAAKVDLLEFTPWEISGHGFLTAAFFRELEIALQRDSVNPATTEGRITKLRAYAKIASSNTFIPDLSQERSHMRLTLQSWIRAALLAIAVLLALSGVAVMMFVSPTYEASARIKVEKEIDPGSFADRNHLPVDPYWVQEQFQVLRSKAVLFRVITNLALTQRWGNLSLDDADVRLPGNLIVRPFPSTSLVEIGYWSKDPQESANVANAIATTYRDLRLEQKRARQAAIIGILEKEVRERDAEIAEREQQPDAESLKQVRERLVTRLQEAKAAPLTSSVEILEIASPPRRPIRDPRKTGLSLIGLGAVLAAFELLTRTPRRIATQAAV